MWKLLLRDCCLSEQLKLRPKVETESDEVDTKHPPTLNLEIEDDRRRLSIAYQNCPNTGQRIAVIGGQFRVYNNADLLLPRDIFGPHPGPAQAQAELDMLITIIAWQRTRLLSLVEGWFPRI